MLSYFEGTANVHCYTSCILTTLPCSKVTFFQFYNKDIIKIYIIRYIKYKKNVRGVLTSVRYCIY